MLAALLVAAAPAAAQERPQPCDGKPLIADAAGDQIEDPSGLGAGRPGPANADIRGVFLLHDGKRTTAHIAVAELRRDVPASGSAIYWHLDFTVGGVMRWVRAESHSDGSVAYRYGTRDGSALTIRGTTTGSLAEGVDGVATVVIPSALVNPGDELTAVAGVVHQSDGVNVGEMDRAPDGGAAQWVVGPCGGAAEPTPSQPPATTAGPSGSLPLAVPDTLGSAARATRRDRLGFKARARVRIHELRVVLRDASGRVVARARRHRRTSGIFTLVLRVERRLRAGSYVFEASAVAAGRRRTYVRTVRLRS